MLGDVAARGKSFIQVADHAVRTLWEFVQVFHPELQKRVAWYKLKNRLMAGGENEKALVPLIEVLERPFKFLRNRRKKPTVKPIRSAFHGRNAGSSLLSAASQS